MKSDIEIAQEAKMKPITEIAASLGLADEDVIPYGRYKAKINHRLIHKASKQGKMVLVTAISPTPAGEGKTTTSVGLADAMNALGKKTMLCLREPSLGPVFGVTVCKVKNIDDIDFRCFKPKENYTRRNY